MRFSPISLLLLFIVLGQAGAAAETPSAGTSEEAPPKPRCQCSINVRPGPNADLTHVGPYRVGADQRSCYRYLCLSHRSSVPDLRDLDPLVFALLTRALVEKDPSAIAAIEQLYAQKDYLGRDPQTDFAVYSQSIAKSKSASKWVPDTACTSFIDPMDPSRFYFSGPAIEETAAIQDNGVATPPSNPVPSPYAPQQHATTCVPQLDRLGLLRKNPARLQAN